MATFKVLVLRANKKRDGSMPISVQLTHTRQRRYVSTPHVAFSQQLDRRGSIKDPNLKLIADGIYRAVKEALDRLSFRVAAYTPDELKEHVAAALRGGGAAAAVDFFAFADAFIAGIRGAQPGTAANHAIMLRNLERYLGVRRLSIADLTAAFLHRYRQWMAAQGAAGGGALGEHGQSLYLGSVRAIFNAALQRYNDHDKGHIPIPHRPFERFRIPKARNLKTAEQKAITPAQLRAIRAYAPRRRRDALARDCFLLSFYLCGMNSVDLYRCAELLPGGILRYSRAKVAGRRADRAEMRVRVEPEALPLLEKYRDPTGERVFAFHKMYTTPDNFNAALNAGLKLVGQAAGVDDLEFYYARHSWATIAANDCGLSVDLVDQCLAHADPRLAAKHYIKKDWGRVYAANRTVIDFLK